MDSVVDSNSQKFDAWLFALDIVNFVFLKSSKLPHEAVIGSFPGFVCKDFSDTLKVAVQLIRNTVKKNVDENFVKFQQRDELNPDAYLKYAKDLKKERPCRSFEAKSFLYYSVNLALMAFRFCYGGVRKAQISAVCCVAEDLQDCGSNYCLWEAFNETAEKIIGGVTSGTNYSTHPALSRGDFTEINADFTSPEVSCKDKVVSPGVKDRTNPDGGKVIDTSSKYFFSADLSKTRSFTSGILANSCRRINNRAKYRLQKDHDCMSSLHESLESSFDQLSISSAFSLIKTEHASNSTPAESSVMWKRGTLKRIPYRNSYEKQIFKLSPINRIKAESVVFH